MFVCFQVATIPTTFGVYFAHLTSEREEQEELLPAALVSSVPSLMSFAMFFFCPISTAFSRVSRRLYFTLPVQTSTMATAP